MRLPAIELLRAARGRYALGAFNVCNLEQIHGLFRGAAQARAPILVQFTRVIRQYAHPLMLDHLLRAAEQIHPEVPFAVHLDHGDEPACADAIASGHYSSVMIDASHLPFAENVAVTRRVADAAHARGLMVEAELGQLCGVEDDEAVASTGEAILTDPDAALRFVRESGCDTLAVAVGTSHGAYKFSGAQRLRLDRLAAIHARLPETPLVLHGASQVPADEIARINAAGGRMESSASGVTTEELRQSIPLGVTKVNVGTDGRLVWTRVHREYFRDRPAEFDFMPPGRQYIDAYARLVADRCASLGSAGKA